MHRTLILMLVGFLSTSVQSGKWLEYSASDTSESRIIDLNKVESIIFKPADNYNCTLPLKDQWCKWIVEIDGTKILITIDHLPKYIPSNARPQEKAKKLSLKKIANYRDRYKKHSKKYEQIKRQITDFLDDDTHLKIKVHSLKP